MNRLRADLLLLLAAFFWGTTFIVQKQASDYIGPMTFVGMRFFLSSFCILPLALWENRRSHSRKMRLPDLFLAICNGLAVFLASILQQGGLAHTSATNGGFLTSLYIVLVPFTTWMLMKTRPRPIVGVACMVSIAGAWLLAGGGFPTTWNVGDLMVLSADLVWALGITLVTMFLQRVDRPLLLMFIQFAILGILGLLTGSIFEEISWTAVGASITQVVYAGVMAGAVAYTLQAVAQRHSPPSEAALIMGTESIFAAIAGALLFGERLSVQGVFGCMLIMCGVFLVETRDLFKKGDKSDPAGKS